MALDAENGEVEAVLAGRSIERDQHLEAHRVDERERTQVEHESRRIRLEREGELFPERHFARQIELALKSDEHRVAPLLHAHRTELGEPLGPPTI